MDDLMPTSPEMDKADAAAAEEPPLIDDATYIATQNRVELLSRLLLDTNPNDLYGLIRRAEHLDAVGPFIDPTAWSAGHTKLRMIVAHAHALADARLRVIGAARVAGAQLPEGVDG